MPINTNSNILQNVIDIVTIIRADNECHITISGEKDIIRVRSLSEDKVLFYDHTIPITTSEIDLDNDTSSFYLSLDNIQNIRWFNRSEAATVFLPNETPDSRVTITLGKVQIDINPIDSNYAHYVFDEIEFERKAIASVDFDVLTTAVYGVNIISDYIDLHINPNENFVMFSGTGDTDAVSYTPPCSRINHTQGHPISLTIPVRRFLNVVRSLPSLEDITILLTDRYIIFQSVNSIEGAMLRVYVADRGSSVN